MTRPALVRAHRPPKARRLGGDAWVWIVVIAMTPIQQLLFVLVSGQVRLIPVVAAALSLILGRVARPRAQGALIIAAVFIVLGGVASGGNSVLVDSVTVAVTLALLVAIAPAAILFQIRRYPSFLRVTVALTLAVQTASATAGIVQLAGVPVFGVVARDGRVNGLAYHPNILGVMSALAIFVLLDTLRRRAAPRALILTALGLNAIALIATASLSSLITLAVGALFYLARLTSKARVLALVVSVLLFLVALVATAGNLAALLPQTFADRVGQVTGVGADGEVASLLVRFQTYDWAWSYIARDPFVGVGMDTLNQGTLTPMLVVHNYLLRGWYQGGIMLLAGFIVLTIALVITAARGMKHTPLTAPTSIIVATLAFGMTSAFYTQSNYWLPILASVAVLSDALPCQVTRLGSRPWTSQVGSGAFRSARSENATPERQGLGRS